MAACVHGVAANNTANNAALTTGSFTPAASDLLVAFAIVTGQASGGTFTDSQGLGWTQVASAFNNASGNTLVCCVANALAANSGMTVTFTPAGAPTSTGCCIAVVRVSGMTRTGLTNAVLQTAKQENQTANTAPTSTFPNSVNTSNPTIGCCAHSAGAATLTAPTNWTERTEVAYTTPATTIETCTRDSGFTGTQITWGSGVINPHCNIILELNTAAPGVSFDLAANSGDQAAASSYSGAAVWNGTSRMLSVDVSMLGPGVTVTAMTYGGATCTFIGSKSTVTSLGGVESWRICSSDSGAPAAGSNTLAITLSGSIEFVAEWVSRTGVHQTSPTEAFNSAQATNVGAADATVSITSIADNCVIHGALVANDTSVTANQTSRNNVPGTLGSGANEDTGPITPAGATTVSWTGVGAGATWAIVGYAVRPLAASSGGAIVNPYFYRQIAGAC